MLKLVLYSGWQSLLESIPLLIVHCLVHAIHLFMVPSVAVTPDYLKDLPEAVTMFGCFAYGLLHGTVILDRLVVEVRSLDVHHLARPRDAHSIFFYDSVRNVLFDLGL